MQGLLCMILTAARLLAGRACILPASALSLQLPRPTLNPCAWMHTTTHIPHMPWGPCKGWRLQYPLCLPAVSGVMFCWEATGSWWRGLVPSRLSDLRSISWHTGMASVTAAVLCYAVPLVLVILRSALRCCCACAFKCDYSVCLQRSGASMAPWAF